MTEGRLRRAVPAGRPGSAEGRPGPVLVALCAVLLGLVAAAVRGDEQKAPPSPVDLESLLRLPPDLPPTDAPNAGGLSRERWEERFASAHAELRNAQNRVQETQRELEDIASNSENWQIAAPGAQPTADNSPLSYKLRQELRRRREEVEKAERSLRELQTEASLAGVPEEWRRPPAPHEDAVPH